MRTPHETWTETFLDYLGNKHVLPGGCGKKVGPVFSHHMVLSIRFIFFPVAMLNKTIIFISKFRV